MCLEPLDEPVGGAVVVQFGVGLGKFRENLLRELLAEFNTPLVVAVDVPDNALGEKSRTECRDRPLAGWHDRGDRIFCKILCSYMAMRAPRRSGLT